MRMLLISFLVFVGAIILVHGIVRSFLNQFTKNSKISAREWFAELGQICVITLAITLAISFAMRQFGIFESFFFRPSNRNYGEIEKLAGDKSPIQFQSAQTPELQGWLFKTDLEPIGLVVHFHGSDRNVSFTAQNSHWLTEKGFHVLAFDYRGYGKSSGKPSLKGVVEDGVAALKKAREISREFHLPVVAWGQSLGGQVAILAAKAAAIPELKGVVAEATYGRPSLHICQKMADMGPLWLIQWAGWLVTSDSPNAEDALKDWDFEKTPLLLVHGTEDQGVHPSHSRRMYRTSKQRANWWSVPDARHLKIFHRPEYRDKLTQQLTTWCQSQAEVASRPPVTDPL